MKEEYGISLRIITKKKKQFTKVHTSSFSSNNLAEIHKFVYDEIGTDLLELEDDE